MQFWRFGWFVFAWEGKEKKHWSPQQPSPNLTQHRHKVAISDMCTDNANHKIHIYRRGGEKMDGPDEWSPNKTKIHTKCLKMLWLLCEDYCRGQFKFSVYRKEALFQSSHQAAKLSPRMYNVLDTNNKWYIMHRASV